MTNPIVKVEHLYHRYATQWAVEDICFEIDHSGVVGLLGSNGAGKSTTMNIICGVLKQTQGEVYVNGVNTLQDPIQARKQIGFLPQKAPLYPDLTVDEYLRFCAEMRLMEPKRIRKAVDEAEELCGVTHFKSRLLRNLSGGYQQRVGIAQAILHNPKFVVLDEPTNGLDPNQILEVRHLIRSISEERTVLLSTHILQEIQAISDTILMIEHGKRVFYGSMDDFNNYVEPHSIVVGMAKPPVISELNEMKGVNRVDMISERQFRLWYNGKEDTLKKVVEESVKRNWELVEIHAEKSSLEEIFAKLSGKK
ncbi:MULTISPECIES: ABC transporter ATP-binding protein [unclassified Butyricimonas]|uniref:ABC transporter ATP-binding protein n=1 Tax=unclassified Butyricimonas TaxID=2637652 RepID=UPI000B387592|nr:MULTISPECIES: ABC transporter ATP-binding protein [unclassified Butyricimonas]OUN66342.1 multidrug ABC transporter ATP-binding protein [Butyricimonas sp. An62]